MRETRGESARYSATTYSHSPGEWSLLSPANPPPSWHRRISSGSSSPPLPCSASLPAALPRALAPPDHEENWPPPSCPKSLFAFSLVPCARAVKVPPSWNNAAPCAFPPPPSFFFLCLGVCAPPSKTLYVECDNEIPEKKLETKPCGCKSICLHMRATANSPPACGVADAPFVLMGGKPQEANQRTKPCGW